MSYSRDRDGYRGGGGGGELLTTNMFRLTPCTEGSGIYKHVVVFDPPDLPPRVRAAALHSYDKIGGKDFVLRGDVLIMREKLEEASYEFKTSSGKYNMYVTIKMGTRVDYKDGETQASTINEVLALNSICLKRTLKMFPGVVEMGRSFVDLNTSKNSVQDLNLHNGFGISATWRDGGAYAEIDLSTRIISSDTVWDIIRRSRGTPEADLEGTGIMTKYNNMLYRFKGIDRTQTPLTKFTKRTRGADGNPEERQVSYEEYTCKTYGLPPIRDADRQPMIMATFRGDRKADGTREEREVRLIPSLCYVVGYTRSQESNMKLRRDVSRETKLNSRQRQDKLRDLVDKFNKVCPATCAKGHAMVDINASHISPESHVCAVCGSHKVLYACKKCGYWLCEQCAKEKVARGGFKATIEPRMVEVRSNVIPQPVVSTGGGKTSNIRVEGEPGTWDRFHGYSLSTSLDITNWLIFYESRADRSIDPFLDALGKISGKMNIRFARPKIVRVDNGRNCNRDIERELLALRDYPQLCVFILAGQDKATYDKAKQTFLRFNVVSQMVTAPKASGGFSFVTKIVIQIAAKLGHAPWRVPFNTFPGSSGADVMFVGMDAANGPRGSRVMAMISTVDGTRCERYWNTSRKFNENEAGAIVKEMMLEAIEAHRMNNNGNYPKHVIIYRNGVSDAEIRNIEAPRTGEYAQIAAAFEDLKINPFVDYILVIRTGSLRLFSSGRNPAPGTVVDNIITANAHDPTLGAPRSDFYMVSQKTNEGCVRPTHYRIIVNSSFLTKADLEEVTYKLAHLYYNWTGTVAVPAPVLLAQKLTRMIVEHNMDVTPDGLKEFTYYI